MAAGSGVTNPPHIEELPNYQTAIAARYLLMAGLTSRGFVCAPTIDNAPHVDLLAVSGDMRRALALSVKGTSRRVTPSFFWPIKTSKKVLRFPRSRVFWYAFVDVQREEVFLVPSVSARIRRSPIRKGGNRWYWVDHCDVVDYRNNWP